MAKGFFGINHPHNPNTKTRWHTDKPRKNKLFNLNLRVQRSHKRLKELQTQLMQSYESGMDASDLETDYELELVIYEGVCRDAGQNPSSFPSVAQLVRDASE